MRAGLRMAITSSEQQLDGTAALAVDSAEFQMRSVKRVGRSGQGSLRSDPARRQSKLTLGRRDRGSHSFRRRAWHGRDPACRGRSGASRCCGLCGRRGQSQRLSHFYIQSSGYILIVFQELAGILASLANSLGLVAEPRSRLLQNVVVDRQIEQIAFPRNAFSIKDVELRFAEGRRDLILDD